MMEVPELLTVREVAALLKISPDTVTRRFQKFPGVIDLGVRETRFKRAYKVLRIPRPVLLKFLHTNRVA
jgi:DNA-binding transcriptional regulator YhcF (GntR family)